MTTYTCDTCGRSYTISPNSAALTTCACGSTSFKTAPGTIMFGGVKVKGCTVSGNPSPYSITLGG